MQWKGVWLPYPSASPLLIPADGIVLIPLLSWVRLCSIQTQISYPATCQTARHTLHINTTLSGHTVPCSRRHRALWFPSYFKKHPHFHYVSVLRECPQYSFSIHVQRKQETWTLMMQDFQPQNVQSSAAESQDTVAVLINSDSLSALSSISLNERDTTMAQLPKQDMVSWHDLTSP